MTKTIYFISNNLTAAQFAKKWALTLDLTGYDFHTVVATENLLPQELIEDAHYIIYLSTERFPTVPSTLYNLPNMSVWELADEEYLKIDNCNLLKQNLSDKIALKISFFAESLELSSV